MAQPSLLLEIVSAESMLFSGDVSRLEVTGAGGELGIHPGHTPLLTYIKPGNVLATFKDNKQEVFYVSGGLLEVQPNSVTLLADTAARASDLDEAAALSAKERAEQALADKQADLDYSKALGELAEALAQLRAIEKLRRFKK